MKAAFCRLSPCLLKCSNTYRGSVAGGGRSKSAAKLAAVRANLKRASKPGANTRYVLATETGAIDFRLRPDAARANR
jgi:hypothetical protein